MEKPQNAVKRSIFLGSAAGGAPAFLLRRRSKAYGCATACRGPGAPGRILELTLLVGFAGLLDRPFHHSVVPKAFEWGLASEE